MKKLGWYAARRPVPSSVTYTEGIPERMAHSGYIQYTYRRRRVIFSSVLFICNKVRIRLDKWLTHNIINLQYLKCTAIYTILGITHKTNSSTSLYNNINIYNKLQDSVHKSMFWNTLYKFVELKPITELYICEIRIGLLKNFSQTCQPVAGTVPKYDKRQDDTKGASQWTSNKREFREDEQKKKVLMIYDVF